MSLADVLEPLQQPLFTLLDTPGSWADFLGGLGTQAGLYADAGLQIVFTTWLLTAGVVGTLGLTLLLDRATDSTVPFWDALTTALSLCVLGLRDWSRGLAAQRRTVEKEAVA